MTTAIQDRLPRRTKFFYGISDFGFACTDTTMQVLFAIFMTDVVGVRAAYAALAIFIGRTWDYINDPLIGFYSERVRTRWGRRRPFLLFGFIPFVKRVGPKVKKMLDNFYKGVGELRSARFVEIIILTLITWLGEATILYLAAVSLGVQINFVYCVGFYALATLGGVLSSLPGGLGSFEAVVFALLVFIGYPEPISLSIALLYRFLSFGIGISFSAIFFFREIKS